MPQYLLFDGMLNTQILGLQAYLWLMLVFFLMLVGSYALWYVFFWSPLEPVQGHFKAHTSGINSALTFDENLNFKMQSEKRAKLIFDTTIKEAKEYQKDWDYAPSGLIGKVLCDLVFASQDWIRVGSPTRVAIEQIAERYNEEHPEDPIMTLGKFHKRLVDGRLGGYDGLSDIPIWYRVNWRRIDFAIPKDHIQPMWDGYLRQLAKQQNEEQSTDTRNYGYIILGGSILICLGMLGISFLT